MKKLFTLTAALLLMLSATVNAQDNVIKMKTKHAIGEYVGFSIQSNGNEVEVVGADYDSSDGSFKVTSQEIELRGKITRLDCSSNMLESLDVSGNPLLVELYCDNNKYLTNIKLGNQPNLTELYVGDNQLSTIDLSGAPELTSLSCYKNEFKTLNLSAVPKLKDLICRECQIEGTLDLSNNKELQKVACYNNRITAIKLAKDNSIAKMEIERNYINENNMTALVNALPTYKELEDYDNWFGMDPQAFYPFESNITTENNEFTSAHLATLKSKGWPVYCVDNVDLFEDLVEVTDEVLSVDNTSLANNLSISRSDNGINFNGASANTTATLYDMQGRMITSTKSINGNGSLNTKMKGMFIVKIGDKKRKVAL